MRQGASAQPVLLDSGSVLHQSGPPSPNALLFLHGMGGAAWSWRPQLEAFGERVRCYVWECRGHGGAPPQPDVGLGDFYQDASEALAYAVGAERSPVIIVGHSIGGLLGLALACEMGGAVAGLFLIDPLAVRRIGPFAGGAIDLPVRAALEPFMASYRRNGRLGRAVTRTVFERMFADRAAMERAWADQSRQVPLVYRGVIREAFEGTPRFPKRDFSEEIAIPTVLLQAGRRTKRYAHEIAVLSARLGAAFSYEAIPGGHYLQLDRPAEVNARIAAFVERITAHQ